MEKRHWVETTNQTIKSKVAKICATTNLKWPDALPLALLSVRIVPKGRHQLAPCEVVMKLPPSVYTPLRPKSLNEVSNVTLQDYCFELTHTLASVHQTVKNTQPESNPADGLSVQPGEYVFVKNSIRKHGLEPRWKGPFQVLLVTRTAVKITGKKTWVHASHLKGGVAPELLRKIEPPKGVLRNLNDYHTPPYSLRSLSK